MTFVSTFPSSESWRYMTLLNLTGVIPIVWSATLPFKRQLAHMCNAEKKASDPHSRVPINFSSVRQLRPDDRLLHGL